MKKVYKPKLDVTCIFNTLLFVAVFVVYFLFASRAILWFFILCCVVLGICILFSLSLIFFTRYVLTDNYLLIKYGLYSKKIYYLDIISVSDVKNVYPSFCLSADRVKLKVKGFLGVTFISPKDKNIFIDDINNMLNKLDRRIYE